jgi:type IV secretory pathway component VirB8
MSDFVLNEVTPREQTIGLGAFLVAVLIVAALVVAAIKLSSSLPSADTQPPLIQFDNPASLSGFTA